MFRGRHGRGYHHRAIASAIPVRHRTKLKLHLQGQIGRCKAGWTRAWRPLYCGTKAKLLRGIGRLTAICGVFLKGPIAVSSISTLRHCSWRFPAVSGTRSASPGVNRLQQPLALNSIAASTLLRARHFRGRKWRAAFRRRRHYAAGIAGAAGGGTWLRALRWVLSRRAVPR